MSAQPIVINRTVTRFSSAAAGQCREVNEDGFRCVRSNTRDTSNKLHTRHWPRGIGGQTWVK